MTTIRAEQMQALGPRSIAACQPAQVASPPAKPTPPARPAGPPVVVVSRDKPAWLAIELVDESGECVPGEPFTIVMSDGSSVKGALDSRGAVRLEGVPAGTCKVTFTERDAEGWRAFAGVAPGSA